MIFFHVPFLPFQDQRKILPEFRRFLQGAWLVLQLLFCPLKDRFPELQISTFRPQFSQVCRLRRIPDILQDSEVRPTVFHQEQERCCV